jgi:hypothetical protein
MGSHSGRDVEDQNFLTVIPPPKTVRTVVLPPTMCLGALRSNCLKAMSNRRAFGDGVERSAVCGEGSAVITGELAFFAALDEFVRSNPSGSEL